LKDPVTVALAATFAEMIGVVSLSTGIVVIANVAWFWPCATITVAGTLANSDELDRFTGCPPIPALAVNVTRP